jgi:hypothetical protein
MDSKNVQLFFMKTDHVGTLKLNEKKIPEEVSLLGYNAMQTIESQPVFWRNMSPSSSVPKSKPTKKSA